MIKSFKDKETEKIFRGQFSRKLPQDIQRVAARKLEQLNAATVLKPCAYPLATGSKHCVMTARDNIAFE